jgi:hypothetical protein
MAAQTVEWVLVVYYGRSAHRATYGRLDGHDTKYTKDYIQLSRKKEFLDAVTKVFTVVAGTASVPLTYHWPAGTAPGAFIFQSADRPHLKWETTLGAPQAWKMALSTSDATPESIPGDPSHLNFIDAEREFAQLESRGAGQPYLIAIKLRDEPRKLHLRAYLKDPSVSYEWADLGLVPQDIQALAAKTSERSALAWSLFHGGGAPPSLKAKTALSLLTTSENPMSVIDALDEDASRALADYLRNPGHGIFFDPTRNHDAWIQPPPLSEQVSASVDEILDRLAVRFPEPPLGDTASETLDVDPEEVEAFRSKIEKQNYEVPDSTATTKTRGSAQRAFSEAVKTNYGYKCAITGIGTKEFLVASHIVPWSKDQTIRLDPSNGICLSLLVDRAFEKGHLLIDDDFTIHIDWDKIGEDEALRSQLHPFDETQINVPAEGAPNTDYLRRRRALIAASD